MLPGYGVHFIPKSGTMMAIRTPVVLHGTREMRVGSTIGIALACRQLILNQAKKREAQIDKKLLSSKKSNDPCSFETVLIFLTSSLFLT